MGPGVLADCTKVPFVATSPPAQPGARNCHDCCGHLPVVPWLLARSQSSGESLPACNAINRGHGSRWLALLPADAVKIEMASGVLNPQGRSVPQSHSTFLSGRRSFHRTGAGANRVESGAVPECPVGLCCAPALCPVPCGLRPTPVRIAVPRLSDAGPPRSLLRLARQQWELAGPNSTTPQQQHLTTHPPTIVLRLPSSIGLAPLGHRNPGPSHVRFHTYPGPGLTLILASHPSSCPARLPVGTTLIDSHTCHAVHLPALFCR